MGEARLTWQIGAHAILSDGGYWQGRTFTAESISYILAIGQLCAKAGARN